MTAVNVSRATGGSKLYSYLERKPENYDVSFAVGPQKIIVKALRVILKSSSTVFEKEFDDKWEVAVLKEGEGISLPDLDPEAFKLFIKLMITDTWSVEALKELKLPANQLLNLLSICRRYEIANGVESLQELLQEFLGTFASFVETAGFLNLSRINLETLLSSEGVVCEESKIFECTCRWAEKKCIKGSMETNGKNFRDLLGPALFQIRFPIMTNAEFIKAMRVKNILTAEEIVQIFMYIGMDEKEKKSYDLTDFPFNTQRRSAPLEVWPPASCSTVSTKSLYPIINRPFVCNGKVTSNWNSFIIDKDIAVYGVGFHGPIDADAYYDVTVEFKAYSYNNGPVTSIKKEGPKTLLASKGKVFYFNLDEPLSLQKNVTSNDSHRYIVEFSLKGPNTLAIQKDIGDWKTLHEDEVCFKIIFGTRQMPEIIFKKI